MLRRRAGNVLNWPENVDATSNAMKIVGLLAQRRLQRNSET